MRPIVLLVAVAALSAHARAQSSWFITVQGKDTVSLEQYSRSGNTITGTWIAIHDGVFTHRYVLTLGRDGMPGKYTMDYNVEGRARLPAEMKSVTFVYEPDSVIMTIFRDTAETRRLPLHGSVPVLGRSVVGIEIALAKLRAAHADSGLIVAHAPTSPPGNVAQSLKVKLFGSDSAIVAGQLHARFAKNGQLIAYDAPGSETHSVPAYDMNRMIAAMVVSDSAKSVKSRAEMASRTEIALPAEAFDKFVGDYKLTEQLTVTVKRDGERFMMGVVGQPLQQIFAMSPTKFFLKQVNVTVEFEVGPDGRGAALTLAQGGVTQHAMRVKG